ncbi:MAG TPA: penicillin acylase family protein [Stenotrophomonas sp.]|nr:penicillin acylase family protein [Stenotrophomonas sp.]
MRNRIGRWLLRAAILLVVLILLAALACWLALHGSLPATEGEHALAGLGAPVRIERDALGVVTIDAASEADAMRALGYVHAQERYFEMDLMRRVAAGELSELFGPAALDTDRQNRVHRLRARVNAHLDASLGQQRPILDAYRDGANAGLQALSTRPWPYLLLRQRPRAWALDDSILVGLAMYGDLQDSRNRGELALARIREVAPPALYALLAHDGSSWDAPLLGSARGDAQLPDAAALDLRRTAPASAPTQHTEAADVVGSNNFAVSAALTADGRAILADDMHLSLRAPNIWFRARLRYPDPRAPGGRVDVSGFTLPGIPAVIVGSNGHVAWGFTNSYIDTADYARIPAGAKPRLHEYQETIRVAGAAPVPFKVRESDWGPVLEENPDGSLLTLRWAAQLPGAVRLDFIDIARAGNLDQALAVADRSGIPAQNLMLADSSGRIAWRIIGARPDRGPGCTPGTIERDPTVPRKDETAASCAPWPLRTDAAPSVIDPPTHRLWTANNRIVDDATLAVVGNGGYDLGARARQIRDDLFARERFSERDLLAIQLDDRALFLQRWWPLLRQVVEPSEEPALRRLEVATRQWDGRASTASVSYRVVRAFRDQVLDRILDGLTADARARLGDAYLPPPRAQLEGIAWPLLQQRPAHLLPPVHVPAAAKEAAKQSTSAAPTRFTSWDDLLADAARQTEQELSADSPDPSAWTWGARNTTAICHPISRALPTFARSSLCMPAQALPGDRDMPRVQGPAFGASERMVVSPGHEDQGYIHMPGGQSGHPLSPFWGAGHEDWARGEPTPFLPGPARYVLTLK